METHAKNSDAATAAPAAPADAAAWRRRFVARSVDFICSFVAAWFAGRVVLLDWCFGFRLEPLCDPWAETMASWCHACESAARGAGVPDWLLHVALNVPSAIEGLVFLVLACAIEAALLVATGWTPGTLLAGVRRRRDDGGRIGFRAGFGRTLRIVAPPLVLFLAPLFVLPDRAEPCAFLVGIALAAFDPCRQIVRRSKNLPFSWDAKFATRVIRQATGRRIRT